MTAAELASRMPGQIASGAIGQTNPDEFRVGVTVVHPEFGLGRIVALEGEGSGRKGRVAFAVGPARTFVLAKSPVRPVGKSSLGGSPWRAKGDGSP